MIDDLLRQTDFLRPYDLIDRILTRHDGRRKLLARLGAEAEDGINALLSQALAYESGNVPSLTGFLLWMETDDLEINAKYEYGDFQSDNTQTVVYQSDFVGQENFAGVVPIPVVSDYDKGAGDAGTRKTTDTEVLALSIPFFNICNASLFYGTTFLGSLQ